MNLPRPLLVGLLASAALLGAVPLAHASFGSAATASADFSSDTLAPATGLVLDRRCGLLTHWLDAEWTASDPSWADGYRVELLRGEVVLQTQSPGPAVRAATFTLPDLLFATTYQVRIAARYKSWTSQPISASNSSC